mmetsp:Transcript_4851/g.10690  ORF Transcript_4851/g.10690 Transcript_4851/m.10690 type:complete len:105 (+) Transcript_4851:237-551(+)
MAACVLATEELVVVALGADLWVLEFGDEGWKWCFATHEGVYPPRYLRPHRCFDTGVKLKIGIVYIVLEEEMDDVKHLTPCSPYAPRFALGALSEVVVSSLLACV